MIAPARITREDAGRFVYAHHRTHDPDQGDRFVLGAWDMKRDVLCGVAVVGNPRAPALTALGTLVEVTRCCTDGTRNACSWLYAAAAEHARLDGWYGIVTYTLELDRRVAEATAELRRERDEARAELADIRARCAAVLTAYGPRGTK